MQLDTKTHVLIVDDQEPSRELARVRLLELGLKNVGEAEDGQEALEYIAESFKKNNPVELILCDQDMPEVDGFQFFRVLRQTKGFENIPFMMVTSHSEPEFVASLSKWGIHHFIVKPITAQVLGEKLVKALVKNQA